MLTTEWHQVAANEVLSYEKLEKGTSYRLPPLRDELVAKVPTHSFVAGANCSIYDHVDEELVIRALPEEFHYLAARVAIQIVLQFLSHDLVIVHLIRLHDRTYHLLESLEHFRGPARDSIFETVLYHGPGDRLRLDLVQGSILVNLFFDLPL